MTASLDLAITLTTSELEIAAAIGCRRQVQNLSARRTDRNGAEPGKGWQYHIEGAAGEMAVAKWAGRYWNGNIGNLAADDVGRLQVRTASGHGYSLLIYPTDADDKAFILVTGLAPAFVLRGWIWGREGKRQEWWSDPVGGRPAFFVPQAALRPVRLPAVRPPGEHVA